MIIINMHKSGFNTYRIRTDDGKEHDFVTKLPHEKAKVEFLAAQALKAEAASRPLKIEVPENLAVIDSGGEKHVVAPGETFETGGEEAMVINGTPPVEPVAPVKRGPGRPPRVA